MSRKFFQIKYFSLIGTLNKKAILGEVAERLKAHAWKACLQEIVTGVRIPFSPLRVAFLNNIYIFNPLTF